MASTRIRVLVLLAFALGGYKVSRASAGDNYRADMVATADDGQQLFGAFFAIAVRDRIIVFHTFCKPQDVLDEAARTPVNAVEFTPDWSLPPSQLDPPAKTVRISQVVSSAFLSKKVSPTYPEAARAAKLRGTVVVNALLSRAGEVQRLWVIGADPQLAAAAVEAVRHWSYKPYLLGGVPVGVQTTISVDFELSGDALRENSKFGKNDQHGPESGGFVDGVYTNEYFGFSCPLGESWFVNDLLNKVAHPGTVFLLGVDRHTDKPLRQRTIVLADQAIRYHPPLARVRRLRFEARACTNDSGTGIAARCARRRLWRKAVLSCRVQGRL